MLKIMTTADWIQTLLLIATIIGLLITIVNNRKQLRIFNDQLRLNFFAEYTKRYQEIMLNLPLNISDKKFDYDKLSKKEREKTLKYIRSYFDLCSEEYDLWNSGYIEERIWKNWEEGIEFAFSKKAFRDAWELINLGTVYYSDFSKWINKIIEGKNSNLDLTDEKLILGKIKEKKKASR
jgi:hypothetical protein